MTDKAATAKAAKPTPEELEASLRAEHGRIVACHHQPGPGDEDLGPEARQSIYFRRMTPAQHNRFVATIARDSADLPIAQRRLLQDCLIHPTWVELEAVYQDYPALETAHFVRLQSAAGMTARFTDRRTSSAD